MKKRRWVQHAEYKVQIQYDTFEKEWRLTLLHRSGESSITVQTISEKKIKKFLEDNGIGYEERKTLAADILNKIAKITREVFNATS